MRGILIRLLLTALSAAGFSVLVHAPSYADTVCSQTDPATGECLIWIEVPGTPGTPGEPVTTGRRTPAPERPATGMAPSQGITKPPPGPVPCSSPAGYWSNSYHCYISPVEPQPPAGDPSWQGHEPGDGAVYNCYQPQTGLLITIWSQDPPPDSGTGPTPREVAQIAIEQMHLSAINIGIAPEPGPDSIGLVGMPVWMWAKNPNAHTVGPITASASAGGITVTATAKVLADHLGHGRRHRGRLQHGGHAVQAGVRAEGLPRLRPHLQEVERRHETDDAYTVTATSSWVITWSGAGQTGTIRLNGLNRSTQIRIGEAQVLVN